MAHISGQTYVGGWAGGVRSGFGTCAFPDGTTFEGYFKQDLKHGVGTLRHADGTATDQVWEHGKLVGPNDITSSGFPH